MAKYSINTELWPNEILKFPFRHKKVQTLSQMVKKDRNIKNYSQTQYF